MHNSPMPTRRPQGGFAPPMRPPRRVDGFRPASPQPKPQPAQHQPVPSQGRVHSVPMPAPVQPHHPVPQQTHVPQPQPMRHAPVSHSPGMAHTAHHVPVKDPNTVSIRISVPAMSVYNVLDNMRRHPWRWLAAVFVVFWIVFMVGYQAGRASMKPEPQPAAMLPVNTLRSEA
jgi:hypothetical protein